MVFIFLKFFPVFLNFLEIFRSSFISGSSSSSRIFRLNISSNFVAKQLSSNSSVPRLKVVGFH